MVDTVIVENEVPPTSAVSWPAIIAGAFVAAAFTLLLLALGAGLGFSVVSPWRGAPDITSTKAATVGGIFMAVTAVMASALGGYIAGRLRRAGCAHRSTRSIFATPPMACCPGPSPP